MTVPQYILNHLKAWKSSFCPLQALLYIWCFLLCLQCRQRLALMTLCWLQTISSLQTVIMAGFIFYHPKLGEKRNKLLEEAFKLEVIFSFLNHQLVLKRSGSERWWEDFCGWNTDSVWGKKKIFPCFLKRNFPITIVFFCASKCDYFSISMHSESNNWTFLSNNGKQFLLLYNLWYFSYRKLQKQA